jgi:hypothetical protein
MKMGWKPEFKVSGEWCGNGVCFATEAEALANAYAKFAKWSAPTAVRAVPSAEEPNYKWENGRMVGV